MARRKLGVVIPAYMAEGTIREAVISAKNAGADQIVVVDDGSTDRTYQMAKDAGATCVRQANAGAVVARATGATHIDTEYLIFLDADDRLIPSGVAASVAHLDSSPEDVVAAGTVIGVGVNERKRKFPIRYSPVNTTSLLQKGYGPWPPCAAVIRTSAYEASLRISPAALKTAFAEDYELLIRLSMVGNISVRDDPTCLYALAGGKSEKSARLAVQCKEDIRGYYAAELAINFTPLNEKEAIMAADVRRARAAVASRRFGYAGLILVGWFFRDPVHATKKLAGRPWVRN